ncbi:hypothetical protein FEM48_Zijuj05G0022500 [Ziziphus jujuba var. spinosa]|uniref:Uncharacterized protein n=1 Tax=Ziziphus jujuba var. spinosa TaxID=714518 RepID=A0A978VC82_ZIZJJ|nr:hypothetical protein FEM48_Zijuj05G0022500 [Ziziphus jujuba var. spinosa]
MVPRDKSLFDKFRYPRNESDFKLSGIAPENRLFERSIDDNSFKLDILSGICPLIWFLDKFRNTKPSKFVSSLGRSPDKLFAERSKTTTRERVLLNVRDRSLVVRTKFSS